MEQKKRFTMLTAGLVIILSLAVIAYIATQARKGSPVPQNTSTQEQEAASVSVLFDAPEAVTAGQTFEMRVSAEPAAPALTAGTIDLQYDPEALEVQNIAPGTMWTQANVLQKTVDNGKGQVLYSIGQGFQAQSTGEGVIAVVTFLAKQTGSTALRLGPETLLVRTSSEGQLGINFSEKQVSIN